MESQPRRVDEVEDDLLLRSRNGKHKPHKINT